MWSLCVIEYMVKYKQLSFFSNTPFKPLGTFLTNEHFTTGLKFHQIISDQGFPFLLTILIVTLQLDTHSS